MRSNRMCCRRKVINHSLVKAEWFIFYLLKITTNVIIKAIARIVTSTKLKNSRYIICNSILSIAPPRFPTDETVKFKGGNTLCFILIFLC